MVVLTDFFEKFRNEPIEAYLKNKIFIQGNLLYLDVNGNLIIKFAKIFYNNIEIVVKELIVRGSCVRYIVLPSYLNYAKILGMELQMNKN
mmetsp:Transcript_14734/g.20631  ORF Transcript_14734/g.20631 Transcript_14734/m.20631 type:complete len:90 (+) Transcript_14734:180-449(+)